MTVVEIIDTITEWARREICTKIKLKCPPEDTEANAKGYNYKLMHPACFSLFVPTKDKLPPAVLSPIPSICVRVIEGEDSMNAQKGSLTIELCLSTWDTGIHGKDILEPVGDNRFKISDIERYQKDGGGWRDAWNLLDTVLREIEGSASIEGIQIDRTSPVKFGPYTEQESIPDFYPFWFAWVRFKVTRALVRNVKDYENLL